MSLDKTVLRTRVMTAIVFSCIVVGSILSGKTASTLLLAVIGIGSTWEYLRLVKLNSVIIRALGVILFIGVFCLFYFIDGMETWVKYGVLINSLLFIAAILNLFFRYIDHSKWFGIVALFYTILPMVLAIWVLQNVADNSLFLLYILILIWVSDSSAYFAGSLWGKHKLFERISPKKTWEGFLGAGIFTLITAMILYYFIPGFNLFQWGLLALVVWVIGTLGDLFESSIKRECNAKDSGTFLPGHGGFLDRFDSLIFVLPFALYILFFMN